MFEEVSRFIVSALFAGENRPAVGQRRVQEGVRGIEANLIGLLIAVIAIYWAAWKFTEHRSSSSSVMLSEQKAFALVGSAILVETALMKVGFIFADSIAAQRINAPFNDPTIWDFAIPFAAGALLVAMWSIRNLLS